MENMENTEKENVLTEGKFKRLVVAVTVGAVLLLVILLSVMVYQLIAINKERREIAELESEIALYDELYAGGEDTLEARSKRLYIERRARELGYVYEGDVPLN